MNSEKRYTKIIERKCVICSKKMKIKIYEGGSYSIGHYFGTMKLPIGKGKNIKVGTTRLFGKKSDVVKWIGKHNNVEYWECNACYENAAHEEWLRDNLTKLYGKPCPDYEPQCIVCQVWDIFDTIINKHNL